MTAACTASLLQLQFSSQYPAESAPAIWRCAAQDGVQFQICRLGKVAYRAKLTTVINIDHILFAGSNGEFRKYMIVSLSLCGRFNHLVSQLQYRLHTKFALGKDFQGSTVYFFS